MSDQQKTIVCFGTGPAFKGGMSNYNTSLAKSLAGMENTKVHIVSWSEQYPSIIPREFKDKVSTLDFLDGFDISINYLLNYNNPFSWSKTAKYIASLNPDKVIIQWSIAIQGLPLHYMVKKLKKICNCEVIFDMHFVIQKEKSNIDKKFTRFGIKQADTFIVHALKTFNELKQLFPEKKFALTESGERQIRVKDKTIPVVKLFHPIYDLYQPDPNFDIEAFKKENGLKEKVFLYFGFIREYKGLHHAIPAFKKLAEKHEDVSFLICGELFWKTLNNNSFSTKFKKFVFGALKSIFLKGSEGEGEYNPLKLVDELGISDRCMVVDTFIPNEDVNKYFQVANAGILFYESATPSGIESLSYNFDLPILTSNRGHFPETIKEGLNGYMAKEYTEEEMTATMERFLANPIPPKNVADMKDAFSWEVYSNAILRS